MTAGRTRWLALSLVTIFVLLALATLWLEWVNQTVTVQDLSMVVVFGAFAAIGALIAIRLPRNAVGWICIAVGLGPMFALLAREYATYAVVTARGTLPATEVAGWLQAWLWVPTAGLAFTFLPLLFPDGRLLAPRWRAVAALDVAALMMATFAAALGATAGFSRVPYPDVVAPGSLPRALVTAAGVLAMLAAVSSAFALVRRYRRSSGDERVQLTWVVSAVVVLAASIVAAIVFPPLDVVTFPLGLLPLPIAIGIAVLRYRLYDIDVIINRALVYVPLVGILGGLYTASVALFQRVSVAITGDRSDAAIIVTTLIVASVFTPIRKWLEDIVERRFSSEPGTPGDTPAATSSAAVDAELDARIESIAERVAVRVVERLAVPKSAAARDRNDDREPHDSLERRHAPANVRRSPSSRPTGS